MESTTYYIEGLLRQSSAEYARRYLGIEDDSGNNLLTNFGTQVVTAGYMVNTVPLWQDVRIPMSSMRTGASGIDFSNFRGTVRAAEFKVGATKDLEFELQLPHGHNESATYGVRLHIHWATAVATGAQVVRWNVETTYADIGQVFNTPTAPTTYFALGATAQGYEHTITPLHTFTGLHESAVICGRIWRGGSGQTFAADPVWGLSLDAHFVVEKAGSLDEMGD